MGDRHACGYQHDHDGDDPPDACPCSSPRHQGIRGDGLTSMSIAKYAGPARIIFWLTLVGVALTCPSFAQAPSRIQTLVSAGKLEGMQWPNFSDYRPWLQKFYEPAGFAPAWLQGTTPSPQARAMIELFAHAWQKGLEPDDYDAARWEERLHSLQGSGGDPDAFDVALTV